MWYLVLGPAGSGKTTLICNLYSYLHYLSLKNPGKIEVLGEVLEIDLGGFERVDPKDFPKYPLSFYCIKRRREYKYTPINMCYELTLNINYKGKRYTLKTIDFGGGLLDPEQRGREIEDLRSRFISVLLSMMESKLKALVLVSLEAYYDVDLAVKTSAALNFLFQDKTLLNQGFWKSIKEYYIVATKIDLLWRNWRYLSVPPSILNIDFYIKTRSPLNEIVTLIKSVAREYSGIKDIPILAVGFEEENNSVKELIDEAHGDTRIPLLYGYGYLLLALLKGYNWIDSLIRGKELFQGRLY
ncbi:MAG: hypothetical protein B6U89_07180 [Desulfurococcales archaeon ex4484_58]|nr:MAG: hypothetical protein B6U89_07180 [Desulfurococcales archaeon ex4484_58]